jgi:hypothetical protein
LWFYPIVEPGQFSVQWLEYTILELFPLMADEMANMEDIEACTGL